MKNIVLALSGPSGVGKGTLKNKLLTDPTITESVSCTTRAPRDGEVDGRDYFFLTEQEFLSGIERGEFLEYDRHFGNYYGTPRSFVERTLREKSVVLEIDVRGATCAKEKMQEIITVFIAPPSEEELFRRLRGRGTESEEQIANRLQRAQYEMSFCKDYDYVIVNDDLERAYRELCDIVARAKNQR